MCIRDRATISEINKSGYKPFEEVSESIKRTLIREKKVDQSASIAQNIKEQVSDKQDLSGATSAYPKANFATASNFTAAGTIPGLGRDPAFSQDALNDYIGKIEGPVKASRGSYLIKVTERTAIDSTLYNIQKNSLRDNLLTQKKNMIFSDWLAALKDEAEIEDSRYLFYR
jgi:peptidylprolyl isomerase/peptidyl-prolyl cis-trans isomerase D